MSTSVQLTRRPWLAVVALVFASWVTVACNIAELAPGKSPVAASIPVQVINDHSLDIVVYLLTGGTSVRIGNVPAFSRRTLRVGQAFAAAGTIQLALDPIGTTERHTLEPILVSPGQVLQLTIENYLPFSTWAAYSPEDAPVP